MAHLDSPPLLIEQGICYALFAYDTGLAINLDEAERHVTAIKERGRIRHKARAPHYFEYRPAPLRLTQETVSLAFGDYRSSEAVEVMLYDFGAVTVIYRIPINGPFEGLLSLSESLYENETLLAESRHRLDQLVRDIRPAIDRPSTSSEVEDYLHAGCHPNLRRSLRSPVCPRPSQRTHAALRSRNPRSDVLPNFIQPGRHGPDRLECRDRVRTRHG